MEVTVSRVGGVAKGGGTRTATTGINYAEGAEAKFWPNLLRRGGGVGGWV